MFNLMCPFFKCATIVLGGRHGGPVAREHPYRQRHLLPPPPPICQAPDGESAPGIRRPRQLCHHWPQPGHQRSKERH